MLKRTFNQLRTDGLLSTAKHTIKSLLGKSRATSPDEVAVVYEILKNRPANDAVMIDVGGHFGESFRPFALDGWTIHTFEPDPANREILEKKFGALPNLHLDTRGVSNEVRANVPFFRSDVSSGISGLSSFHESHVEAGSIELTTLSAYFKDYGITKVDFLKIDTEGFDFFVLQGLPWDTHQPDAIVCEFEDLKTQPLGYVYSDMGAFLREKGYTVLISEWHPIQQYGVSHQWRALKDFPAALEETDGWGNLIAFRDPNLCDQFRMKFRGRDSDT